MAFSLVAAIKANPSSSLLDEGAKAEEMDGDQIRHRIRNGRGRVCGTRCSPYVLFISFSQNILLTLIYYSRHLPQLLQLQLLILFQTLRTFRITIDY